MLASIVEWFGVQRFSQLLALDFYRILRTMNNPTPTAVSAVTLEV